MTHYHREEWETDFEFHGYATYDAETWVEIGEPIEVEVSAPKGQMEVPQVSVPELHPLNSPLQGAILPVEGATRYYMDLHYAEEEEDYLWEA